jgi:hypothetical protein
VKETEIRNLYQRLPAYPTIDENVGSLEISVYNPSLVSGVYRPNQLDEDCEGFVKLDRSSFEAGAEAFAVREVPDQHRPKI